MREGGFSSPVARGTTFRGEWLKAITVTFGFATTVQGDEIRLGLWRGVARGKDIRLKQVKEKRVVERKRVEEEAYLNYPKGVLYK